MDGVDRLARSPQSIQVSRHGLTNHAITPHSNPQELGITRAQASLAEEAKARQREFDEQVHFLNARVAALEEKVRSSVLSVCLSSSSR